MEQVQSKKDLSVKIKSALDKAIGNIISKEKAKNGYLITGDEQGNIKKVPAKDL